jgi:hypothetical protein
MPSGVPTVARSASVSPASVIVRARARRPSSCARLRKAKEIDRIGA